MFWDQFLKVAASAADPANDKYQTARERAYDAILNVRDDADRQLQRLSWDDRMGQLVRKEGLRLMVFRPDPSLTATAKVEWCFLLFFSWLCLITALLLYILILFLLIHWRFHPTVKRYLVGILPLGVVSNLFSFAAGRMRFEADKLKYILKYPRPERPILDRM